MFGTEDSNDFTLPSQIIESVYPGVYDEHFLEKADKIHIIRAEELETTFYKINEDGLYGWHKEGKPIADALIAEVRKRNRFTAFIPF